jgi:hypothetical protein
MTRRLSGWLSVVIFFLISIGYAQNNDSTLTVEQRLAALEATAAALETRLAARTSFGGAGSLASADRGIEVTTRLTALEQRVDALLSDLRRIERQADTALRQAGAAEREAARATSLARDAARIR